MKRHLLTLCLSSIALIFASCEPAPPTEAILAMPDPLLYRVPVAVDVAALDAFIDCASRGDNLGKESLVGEGRIFRVDRDTRIKVLASGGIGVVKVEIREGRFDGQIAFTCSEWVQTRPIAAAAPAPRSP